jgi:hypothetical protein
VIDAVAAPDQGFPGRATRIRWVNPRHRRLLIPAALVVLLIIVVIAQVTK